MARAVGIDLGTTNSVVAVLEGGEPTVIANSEGSRTTPSVVAFAKNGEVLVGQPAKNQAVTNVDRTIRSVKRHIGTDWKTADIDGKKYTAQEISARVLLKLKRDAEAYLGEDDHRRGDHRPGVLRGRPAPGHQGGRPDRRPQRAAHRQRAHRGRAGLRPGQGREGADHPGLRPRWRHVRRVAAGDRRGRGRGQGDQRRQPPRWRRLGPADRRLAGRQVQVRPGHRPDQGQDGHAADPRGRREGQDRAVQLEHRHHQPALHHGRRGQEPAVPGRDAVPRRVPADHHRPARPHPRAVQQRDQGRRHLASATSTTWCWSAARPGCPRSPSWSRS